MPLPPGTRLGPYEFLAPAGAGGMGEVYRARDTRLDRDVAIKILPDHLAADPRARERFTREARAISSLSHPHICTLLDVGDAALADGAITYLVLEYLEGTTLAERLGRQRAPLPAGDALAIALQIAEALEVAHRAGIVHRDLKPGNIFLVRQRGASGPVHAKLLDFGLATATPAAIDAAAGATLAHTLTLEGTFVGTPAYMAPEQIQGREVDARSDIWAFGCVLFEMLAGTRPFAGDTHVDTMAAILEREPPSLAELQPATPPLLARIVGTCLAKGPDERFQTMHDLRLQLRWIAESGAGAAQAPRASARRSTALVLAAAAGCMALGASAAIGLGALRPAPPVEVARVAFDLGQAIGGWAPPPAVSPDGRAIAYTADKGIYLRQIDQLTPTVVPGAAGEVVFSPDNQWLAYVAEGSLKKIPISGGVPVTLAALGGADGMSWRAGEIVLAEGRRVLAVPETGGQPRVLVTVGLGERAAAPQVLADGKYVMFAVRPLNAASVAESRIVVERIGGGDRRVLAEGATSPRVLPGGRLVYAGATSLFGVAFHEQTATIRGSPVPLVQGVGISPMQVAGLAQYDVGEAGTLVFQPGTAFEAKNRSVLWVNRTGQEAAIGLKPRAYRGPALSPDATRIAVADVDEQGDIWVWDLKRETLTRVTSGEARDTRPLWTADGRSLIYTSDRRILRAAADGTGSPETLLESQTPVAAGALSPDGRFLVYQQTDRTQEQDLVLLALDDLKRPPRPLVSRPAQQTNPAISPDGRWFVYQSNESGQWEIYLSPFPDGDRARWQVSPAGGYNPAWSRRGELFYLAYPYETGPVTSVTVLATGPVPVLGKPQPLFGFARRDYIYDVWPDGSRFLMTKQADTHETRPLTVVTHWFKELQARVR